MTQLRLVFLCRDSLSEVVCVLRGVPHRLLRLPAVLHRPAELRLHLLLQHGALQRPPEEEARPVGGDVQPADEAGAAPRPELPPPAAADVDASAVQLLLFSPRLLLLFVVHVD